MSTRVAGHDKSRVVSAFRPVLRADIREAQVDAPRVVDAEVREFAQVREPVEVLGVGQKYGQRRKLHDAADRDFSPACSRHHHAEVAKDGDRGMRVEPVIQVPIGVETARVVSQILANVLIDDTRGRNKLGG